MEKTTVYLPVDVHRQLQEVARRTGQSQADLLREAMRQYLARHQRPALRSLGAAESSEITGRNARNWLRENWRRR
ncbi:MAG TPA: ribbon-helix-helix domain-containing protein [Chloroflexota bacterium]|nr:ribbon-helix-helix domain-containing protein [Chloroflexota bacterium]